MKKGKLIVIEGTDCSGKEMQSKILLKKLNSEGINTEVTGFPRYDTPTGKIVGLPYLGKSYLADELVENQMGLEFPDFEQECDLETLKKVKMALSRGWFKEGATNVNPRVACLYYAADRLYNYPHIKELIDQGTNVILDRWTYSNMGHQGGKIFNNSHERRDMYTWIARLEFGLLGLPQADIRIFLHMPTEYANLLKKGRSELPDEHERDINHLINAEQAYIEMADYFNFYTVESVNNKSEEPKLEDIRTPEDIGDEVYDIVKKTLMLK